MNTILYFSPTGNVKYLAERLSYHLDNSKTELLPLEFTSPASLKQVDQLIIMYSIHAFNPPRTVKRFVRGLPTGLYNNVSLISVGCAESWVNYAVTLKMRRILGKKGYRILVDKIVAMPLTFIMPFPEKLIKELIVSANKRIEQLAELIRNEEQLYRKVPIRSKLVNIIGKAESPMARLFGLELHAGKKCTSCGICVKKCPEKNIKYNKNNKPVFGLRCLMCLRCIYNCPEKTISPRISKFIPIKKGYSIGDYLDNTTKGE